MKEDYLTVDMEELEELLREVLPLGATVPLRVTGNSMAPFLKEGRDKVVLGQLDRNPRVGDIVLYRRNSGEYILHRVKAVKGSTYTMIGDGQQHPEPGITRDQCLARVLWAERKGKRQGPGGFWWEFFEKIWIRILPLRPLVGGAWSWIKGWKNGV